jgi:hypothetical protein
VGRTCVQKGRHPNAIGVHHAHHKGGRRLSAAERTHFGTASLFGAWSEVCEVWSICPLSPN